MEKVTDNALRVLALAGLSHIGAHELGGILCCGHSALVAIYFGFLAATTAFSCAEVVAGQAKPLLRPRVRLSVCPDLPVAGRC